jgi:hypothetical protein
MPNIYDTQVLTGVVNSLRVPPQFLLETFFPDVFTSEKEYISFDVAKDRRKLAPFVSPKIEGKIVREEGYQTKTFTPAYIKQKTPLDMDGAFKRAFGEMITGNLSAAARQQMRINSVLTVHRTMIDYRMEWMAAQILRTGKVTISGDGYQTVEVDYGRHANLTVILTGGDRWGQSGVSPLKNLQTWSQEILSRSGSSGRNVTMDIDAWNVFKEDPTVQKRLEVQRALAQAPSMRQDAVTEEGAEYMGTVDGFNIWVYTAEYEDDSGVAQDMLPTGTVLMCGKLQGARHFGAIKDKKAGLVAVPYFSKSWEEEDPSGDVVLTQSAPLVVPYRPNATFRASVLSGV